MNKTYTYTYDNAGNIKSISYSDITTSGGLIIKSIGSEDSAEPNAALLPLQITATLTYGNSAWGDLLTSYNGTTITYDEIGNPLSYYNGTSYTFTWEGRRLVGTTKGNMQMSFSYNDEGLRTSKTVNGVTTKFYYDGSLLIKEESPTYTTIYIYDINSNPIGFKSRSNTYADGVWDCYYYQKNLQGDITTIRNASGVILATYSYNAWGDALRIFSNGGATSTAANSHLTYRGYYYDYDLGMYYLQSRYYDQKVGRFISADDISYLGAGNLVSYNLFSYCGNNPVMGYDPYGTLDWRTFISGASQFITGVGAIAAGAAILACASAPSLMVAVAVVTVVAGALTATNGTAEMIEAQTGNNFVRDNVMDGDEQTYDQLVRYEPIIIATQPILHKTTHISHNPYK